MQMWKYDALVWAGRQHVERYDTIPITAGSPYTILAPIVAQVGPQSGGILTGDIFIVISEFQVTTPYNYNVHLAGALRIATTTATGSSNGADIGEGNGQNFNREEHHFTIRKSGMWVADKDYDSQYIRLDIHAASSAAASGDRLVVNQDYGFMHVLQLRA